MGKEFEVPGLAQESTVGQAEGARGSGLRAISVFRTLPDDVLETVERHCRWRHYAPKAQVIGARDSQGDVLILAEGMVRVVSHTAAGVEVTCALLTSGDVMGEDVIFGREPHITAFIAIDNCLVAAIPHATFMRLLHGHPALAVSMLHVYSAAIQRGYERIQEHCRRDARGRVCLALLRLATPSPVNNRSWHIYPKRSQAEIASFSGTTRETVSRTLSALERGGIVERKRSSIEIPNKRELERLATGPA